MTPAPVPMTTTMTDRPPGARYEIDADDDTWWELGWDPPLATFYAQHWRAEDGDDNGGEPVTDWHGTRPSQHPDVASLEAALGWAVPAAIRVELEADRAARPAGDGGRP